jgi:predicted neutral ceramidase superfamily lipid hydrolase
MQIEREESNSGNEDRKTRLDRELMELLQELRVAIPGVQFLFAFLLTVPFSQGWAKVTEGQRNVYFAAFVCATLATLLLIAPTVIHRIEFRQRDKEAIIKMSNTFAIWGLSFLAAAIVSVVYVITDFIFGSPSSLALAAIAGVLFAGLWYVLPLARRARTTSE